MHTHLSIIPDTITVRPREDGGMVNVALLADGVHGSTCDQHGRTVHRVAGDAGHVSLMLFSTQAADLAGNLMLSLSPEQRSAIIANFIR